MSLDSDDTNKQALQTLLWMAKVEPLPEGQTSLPYAAIDMQTMQDYRLAAEIAGIWSTSLPIQNKHTAQQRLLGEAGIKTGSIRSNTVLEVATRIGTDAAGEGGPDQARDKIYDTLKEVERNVGTFQAIVALAGVRDALKDGRPQESRDGRTIQNFELASQIACIWCKRDLDSPQKTRDILNKRAIVDQDRRDIILCAAEAISETAMRIARGNPETAIASIQARIHSVVTQNITKASGVNR